MRITLVIFPVLLAACTMPMSKEGGCITDNDCKGNRICEASTRTCVDPGALAMDMSTSVSDMGRVGGVYLWSQSLGTDPGLFRNSTLGLASDPQDNIIVTGFMASPINFGGGTLDHLSGNTFIAKYSSSSLHVWSRNYGTSSAPRGIVNLGSSTAVAGVFTASANFGLTTFNTAGGSDIFIATYDSNGTHLWSKKFGGTGEDLVSAISKDNSGNIIILGNFSTSIDFGTGTLTTSGKRDLFLAKLNSTGAILWAKRYGGSEDDYSDMVSIDSAGNIIIAGSSNGMINFGGGLINAMGYLAKFSSDGTHIWSQSFSERISSVTADQQNNIIFSNGSVLTKMRSDGAILWSKPLSINSTFKDSHLTSDRYLDIIYTTEFSGTASLGGSLLASSGGTDIAIAKFSSSGDHKWSYRYGGSGDDRATANPVVDSKDDIYFGGSAPSVYLLKLSP